MKTILLTLAIFFAFTTIAIAQEEQDSTQRQPPLVTQTKVEQDARLAEQERIKHEKENKAVNEEKKNKKEEEKKAATVANTPSTKKTSTRPGKQ